MPQEAAAIHRFFDRESKKHASSSGAPCHWACQAKELLKSRAEAIAK
jgi:hypothetical protein